MAGDQALAGAYADALQLYAKDVETMALAARVGTADEHAAASLRATAHFQTEVVPARTAWQDSVPADYERERPSGGEG